MRACHWLCQLPRATPHPPSKPLPAFLPSYPWDGGNAKLTPPCVVRGWPPPLLTPSLHPGAVCPSHWGTVLSRQTSQAENHRHAFSTRSGASLCFFFPLWRVTHGCWNHHYQHLTPPTWGRLTHPRLAPGQLGLCSAQGVPMVHRSGLGRDSKLFSFLFSF